MASYNTSSVDSFANQLAKMRSYLGEKNRAMEECAVNNAMTQRQLEQCNARLMGLEQQLQGLQNVQEERNNCDVRLRHQRQQLQDMQQQLEGIARTIMEYFNQGKQALDSLTTPLLTPATTYPPPQEVNDSFASDQPMMGSSLSVASIRDLKTKRY